MDLAEGGSEDGTSTPTEKGACTVTPAPTEKDASTTPPAPSAKKPGMTPEKPTEPKQKGTTKLDHPATPGSESSSSDDDDTKDAEYMNGFLEWLRVDPDYKRTMDDETKTVAHHEDDSI
jgi:hypothetical protein